MYRFDRETLLDLVVNIVPLAILLFFSLLFVLANPFAPGPVATAIQLSVMAVTFVSLLAISYYSGQAIQATKPAEPESFAEPPETAGDAEREHSDADHGEN